MKSKLTDEDIPDLADLMGELSCPITLTIFCWKKTLLPKPKPQLSLGLIAKGADNFLKQSQLEANEYM